MSRPSPPVIDIEQLRAGLAAAELDAGFDSFSCEFIGRFSNDVWRIDLDNDVCVVAKQPYRPERPHDAPDVERLFYRMMAGRPELPTLPIPRFVADLNGILIIEHKALRPFSFKKGVTAMHADAAIDALADWHAAWWNRAPRSHWLPDYGEPGVRQAIQRNYDVAWARHRPRLLEHAPEFAGIGDMLVGRLAATLAPMAEPATLIHGDAHAENVPLTDDGALLLDWQDPRVANPGLDLAVFTTMSFTPEQRLQQEKYIVDRHSSRVMSHDCDWPNPWQDYRLGLLRRAARIVEIADVEFRSLPWVFQRSALAAVEHDVGDLVR